MIPGEFWETSPTPASVSHTGALITRGRGAPSGKKKLLREAASSWPSASHRSCPS